ncbi:MULTISPECIES: hypothetical protein [Cupriavidus]|nr:MULTISPECIES: hypothetical protein [Cupriavidus]
MAAARIRKATVLKGAAESLVADSTCEPVAQVVRLTASSAVYE